MLVHIVQFKLKPEATEEQVKKLIDDAKNELTKIPGVSNLRAGLSIKAEEPFQACLCMELPDEEALAAYRAHPIHVKYVEEALGPVREEMKGYDFID
jgi:hypothetical protein